MLSYILWALAFARIYQGAQVFLIKRRSKGPVPIMKGAEPFFLRAKTTKKVALLLHGFTSSPSEFRQMAKYLQKKGISAYCPLLPGHGTNPARLSITKYEQWIEAVEESIDLLAQEYNQIFLIGNSFGGNLALVKASHSSKIKGVITLATPVYFHRERLRRYFALPLLRNLKLYQKKRYTFPDEQTKERVLGKRVAYNQIPLRSLKQMLKVVDASKKAVHTIECPVLVMQTEGDSVTREGSADYIVQKVKDNRSRVITIPKSYHVFILDKHAEKAYEEAYTFVKSIV